LRLDYICQSKLAERF